MLKKFIATKDKQQTSFQIEETSPDRLRIITDQGEWHLDVHQAGPHHYSVIHEGKSYDLRFFRNGNAMSAFLHGEVLNFELLDAIQAAKQKRIGGLAGSAEIQGPVRIEAMMPGKIIAVKVKVGDTVAEGQGVVVLEAMKMENELTSPKAGLVKEVAAKEGQSVESGTLLVLIE